MLIYNTLSRKKDEFIPINPPNVTMYVCGPTVYNYIHIGNARTFIMSDVIRRYLEYNGFMVNYVMNITDIDDKLIRQAQEEKTDIKTIANKYIDAFFADLKNLNVKPATHNPHATQHIDDIINLINSLIVKGYAYVVDGDVFYDVNKFSGYGKLSGKKTDELESGARIEINEIKKNPLDFSLWKKAKPGEPFWESPWGNGRPGWHIECSAMSCKHLGETIDIHAGGNDLIFPHHENEIAQSEASTGKEFAKYWLHFGFVNFNEEKMSKSLGNFFTAREVYREFSAESIRLFFNQTHYRGPLSYSKELLAASQKGLEKITNLYELIQTKLQSENGEGTEPDFDFGKYYNDFTREMDDDFNTPKGLAVIFDFVKSVNKIFSENEKVSIDFTKKVNEYLTKTAINVFGIIRTEEKKDEVKPGLESELIEMILQVRQMAKENKNYQMADLIRDELNKLGIELKDAKTGTTFKINR